MTERQNITTVRFEPNSQTAARRAEVEQDQRGDTAGKVDIPPGGTDDIDGVSRIDRSGGHDAAEDDGRGAAENDERLFEEVDTGEEAAPEHEQTTDAEEETRGDGRGGVSDL